MPSNPLAAWVSDPIGQLQQLAASRMAELAGPNPSFTPAYAADRWNALNQWGSSAAAAMAAPKYDPRTGQLTPAGQDYANTLTGFVGGIGEAPRPGITAYHGSPHDFDAFKSEAIGTGEGAQAYGHGLYFAQNEGVAKSYKAALSDARNWTLDGATVPQWSGSGAVAKMAPEERLAFNRLVDYAGDADTAASKLRTDGDPRWSQAADVIDKWQADGRLKQAENAGHMYEVNINADPAHFLDWDAPLAEQHPVAQQGALKAWDAGNFGDLTGQGPASGGLVNNTGGAVVRMMGEHNPAAAAQALRDAGVPGIKYYDGGSRAAGSGTRNYVVFDPSTISIMRKYGIGGLIAGGFGQAMPGAGGADDTQQQGATQ